MKIQNPFLRGAVGTLVAGVIVFGCVALLQGGAVILDWVGGIVKIPALHVLVFASITTVALIWVGIQFGKDFFNNQADGSVDEEKGKKNGR